MASVILALAFIARTAIAQDCPAGYQPRVYGSLPSNQTLQWTACGNEVEPTMECATLDVPLDYTNTSSAVLTLPLIRIPANQGTASGKSIVYNPGGPGVSGIESLIGQGEQLVTLAGGEYNIISFDPRGVGLTNPYNCPYAETVTGTELPLDDPNGLKATYQQNENQGTLCGSDEYRAAGELVGTAFVARDINAIFEALQEDGLIRYWGYSYGTLLGATLSAMFPEKIDRVVLDGNINPTDYYHGLNEESVDDVDPALLHFFETCATAGPQYCDVAAPEHTGQQIHDAFLDWLELVKNNTYTVSDVAGETLSYKSIKNYVFGELKSPDSWPEVAQNMSYWYQSAEQTTPSTRVSKREAFDPQAAFGLKLQNVLEAITCGDWDDINAQESDFQTYLDLYEKRSSFAGDLLITILLQCSTWKVNAKEQFDGKFEGIKTKTPILFVNGPYDPVTPLISAQNSSSGFVGSKVLEHFGAGHCSSAHPSTCVMDKVKSYWQTGVIPDVSEICSPDAAPFSNEIVASVNGTGTNKTSSIATRSEEERKFAAAVAALPNLLRPRDPNFEYPAALQSAGVKRDVYHALLAREGTATASGTVPATCMPIATGSGSASSGTAGRPLAQGFVFSFVAVLGFLALY